MTRYAAYMRVSTQEQADSGLGLAAQRETLRAWAAPRTIELEYFTDEGLSGGLPPESRPALKAALERVRSGELDGIVVSKLDRLWRSLPEFGMMLREAQNEGWQLAVCDLDFDTGTPTGKLLITIIAAIAEWEREMIAQRTKDALAAKRAGGWRRPSAVPKETRDWALERRGAGATLQQIADKLNETGPKPVRAPKWTPSLVRSITKIAEREAA